MSVKINVGTKQMKSRGAERKEERERDPSFSALP